MPPNCKCATNLELCNRGGCPASCMQPMLWGSSRGTLEDLQLLHTGGNLRRRWLEQQMSCKDVAKFSNLALLHGLVDAESELIQLRVLLLPQAKFATQSTLQQQLELQEHADRLLKLMPQQLALLLEECYLCGMLDVPQLQQLRQLLHLQRFDRRTSEPLISFYRRLTAELPHFRYDLSLPQHVALLQRYLRLHEACPKPQARRLLNASMHHMSTLPQRQLQRFLDTFNPAQLQQLITYLGCSYIALPPRQQQRLHQVALRVQRGKPRLQTLTPGHSQQLGQLLAAPADEPWTVQQRSYLQTLLDHLLPMPKLPQLQWLQRLQLSPSRMRQLRLVLHNPALLTHPAQLRQLYANLKQMLQRQ